MNLSQSESILSSGSRLLFLGVSECGAITGLECIEAKSAFQQLISTNDCSCSSPAEGRAGEDFTSPEFEEFWIKLKNFVKKYRAN